MADELDQSSSPSLWSRSKRSLGGRGLTFLQHVPKDSKDDARASSDKGLSPKAAHARRREQVRNAQKKHRERKETYIKSLEQQVLRLQDQQAATAQRARAVEEENAMLRGLLEQHKIPIPSQAGGFGPAAKVSVLNAPGGHQRLQVTMPETDNQLKPQLTFDFNLAKPQPRVPAVTPPPSHTRLPSESFNIQPTTGSQTALLDKGLPPLPGSSNCEPVSHPSGLDAPQIGIDFVLALENPCLHHTRSDLESRESYGHILTAQAPLLSHAPRPLQPTSSWTIPVLEIERLLSLSAQLNLAGEITPVQAWSRLRLYPGFEKLNLDQLETLKQTLLEEVQCYGFGAVLDESTFETILDQFFCGL